MISNKRRYKTRYKTHCAFLTLLFTSWLLNGCSLLQQESTTAWLKPGVHVTLPAPTLAQPLKRQQFLTATVNGKSDSLITMLDGDGQTLTLAGLSPIGIRLFKVTYTANQIETEQSIALPQLPPANQVLADIMLSYWPLDVWQNRLPEGWQLKDEQNKRLLLDETGQTITEIHYLLENGQKEPVSIVQYAFHYQITITNMDNGS